MKTISTLAVLALLLVPVASAAPAAPDYPAELVQLLPAWVAEAEAFATAEEKEKSWYPEAEAFLERARAAQAEGRFRTTLFHLETYRELVLANRLIDEANALGHDADAKSLVLQRTAALHDDADAAWLAYRARLHGYEPELSSLQTIEKALYSADIAFSGAVAATDFDLLASEFPKQEGFVEAYVFALVRASATPLLDLGWADAMLTTAVEQEGLPPRVDEAKWTELLNQSAAYGQTGETPAHLEGIDKVARPAKRDGEGMVALVALLAEQRANRASGMQTIFGDAQTRGKDVLADASRGMDRQFNNTTLDTPRRYGLSGVFTSDAIDRVQLTKQYMTTDQADLGTVIIAWSALEHATYATTALGGVSPMQPPTPSPTPTTPANDTPAPGMLALVAIALGVAVVLRRR